MRNGCLYSLFAIFKWSIGISIFYSELNLEKHLFTPSQPYQHHMCFLFNLIREVIINNVMDSCVSEAPSSVFTTRTGTILTETVKEKSDRLLVTEQPKGKPCSMFYSEVFFRREAVMLHLHLNTQWPQNFNNKTENQSVKIKELLTTYIKLQVTGDHLAEHPIQLAQSELNYSSLKNRSDGVTVIWEPQEMPELSNHLLNNIPPCPPSQLETGYTKSLFGKIPCFKWQGWNKREALFHLFY